MESSIAVFLLRHLAPEQLPTLALFPDLPPVALSGGALFAIWKLLLEFDRQDYPYSFYAGFCHLDTATLDGNVCEYSFCLARSNVV